MVPDLENVDVIRSIVIHLLKLRRGWLDDFIYNTLLRYSNVDPSEYTLDLWWWLSLNMEKPIILIWVSPLRLTGSNGDLKRISVDEILSNNQLPLYQWYQLFE